MHVVIGLLLLAASVLGLPALQPSKAKEVLAESLLQGKLVDEVDEGSFSWTLEEHDDLWYGLLMARLVAVRGKKHGEVAQERWTSIFEDEIGVQELASMAQAAYPAHLPARQNMYPATFFSDIASNIGSKEEELYTFKTRGDFFVPFPFQNLEGVEEVLYNPDEGEDMYTCNVMTTGSLEPLHIYVSQSYPARLSAGIMLISKVLNHLIQTDGVSITTFGVIPTQEMGGIIQDVGPFKEVSNWEKVLDDGGSMASLAGALLASYAFLASTRVPDAIVYVPEKSRFLFWNHVESFQSNALDSILLPPKLTQHVSLSRFIDVMYPPLHDAMVTLFERRDQLASVIDLVVKDMMPIQLVSHQSTIEATDRLLCSSDDAASAEGCFQELWVRIEAAFARDSEVTPISMLLHSKYDAASMRDALGTFDMPLSALDVAMIGSAHAALATGVPLKTKTKGTQEILDWVLSTSDTARSSTSRSFFERLHAPAGDKADLDQSRTIMNPFSAASVPSKLGSLVRDETVGNERVITFKPTLQAFGTETQDSTISLKLRPYVPLESTFVAQQVCELLNHLWKEHNIPAFMRCVQMLPLSNGVVSEVIPRARPFSFSESSEYQQAAFLIWTYLLNLKDLTSDDVMMDEEGALLIQSPITLDLTSEFQAPTFTATPENEENMIKLITSDALQHLYRVLFAHRSDLQNILTTLFVADQERIVRPPGDAVDADTEQNEVVKHFDALFPKATLLIAGYDILQRKIIEKIQLAKDSRRASMVSSSSGRLSRLGSAPTKPQRSISAGSDAGLTSELLEPESPGSESSMTSNSMRLRVGPLSSIQEASAEEEDVEEQPRHLSRLRQMIRNVAQRAGRVFTRRGVQAHMGP